MKLVAFAFVSTVLLACGGDDDGGNVDAGGSGSGSGSVTCTTQATATLDAAAKTVTGTGAVTCSASATLGVEVCIEWEMASGTISEISCQTTTRSGVAELSLDHVASCGISAGRTYYAQVTATVNGVSQAEVLSTRVTCI